MKKNLTTTGNASAKKLLITAIKKTVNYNSVLPVLESVYFDGEHGIVTDLENCVVVPFKTGVKSCLYAKKVIDILEIMDSPVWTGDKDFSVVASEGTRKIKLLGDNPDNFVKTPLIDKKYPVIGSISEDDLKAISDATDFVSNDDLRPAMTGILISNEIAATDAHRLYWKKLSNKIKQSFILPAKAAKILLAYGGSWEMTADYKPTDKHINHVCFTREDGVKVIARTIDARFPDYTVVIPTGEGLCTLIVFPDILLKELENAGKFANSSTNMVSFYINKKLTLSANDIDFSMEYKNEVPAEMKWGRVTKAEMEIAFNYDLLSKIIQKMPLNKPLTMKLFGSTKACIINDNCLLMPLMTNN